VPGILLLGRKAGEEAADEVLGAAKTRIRPVGIDLVGGLIEAGVTEP
jgi:hypothetical protein